MTDRAAGAAAGLVVVFVAAMVGWPLVAVLVRAGSDPGVLGRGSVWDVVGFTVAQAALSTLGTVLLGLPVAAAIGSWSFPGRGLLRALVTVPFVLPTLVVAGAVRDVAGTGWIPILAAHVIFNLAVVVRLVGPAWAAVTGSDLGSAAALLGAGPWDRARRVTWPLLRPAVTAAALVVFLFCLTSFGTVLVLGAGRLSTVETEIYRYAVTRGELDAAAVLAILQVLAVAAVGWLSSRLGRGATLGGARSVRRSPTGPVAWAVVAAAVAVVGVAVVAPLGWWVGRSVRGPSGFGAFVALGDRVPFSPVTPLDGILTSLWIAAVAGAVAGLVGVAGALASRRAGWPRLVVGAAVLLPLGTSAVVLGLGYLVGFGPLRGSVWLIPLAHAAVGLPLVWGAVAPAVGSFDDRLLEAASMLGAGRGRRLRRVALPLLAPAIAAGVGLAAVVSLGEFGATAFLSRGRSGVTAPMVIFRLLAQPGAEVRALAAALSAVLAALVTLVVWLVDRGERLG